MRFKPTFEAAARANTIESIVFCTVETPNARDVASAFQVTSIPQFNFFLNGAEIVKFVGANEGKFNVALAAL